MPETRRRRRARHRPLPLPLLLPSLPSLSGRSSSPPLGCCYPSLPRSHLREGKRGDRWITYYEGISSNLRDCFPASSHGDRTARSPLWRGGGASSGWEEVGPAAVCSSIARRSMRCGPLPSLLEVEGGGKG